VISTSFIKVKCKAKTFSEYSLELFYNLGGTSRIVDHRALHSSYRIVSDYQLVQLRMTLNDLQRSLHLPKLDCRQYYDYYCVYISG